LPEISLVETPQPLIAKHQFSIKEAADKYRDWVSKQKFVPRDFDITNDQDKIKAIYVPVWLFEVTAETAWHGEVSHIEKRSRTRHNYIEDRDEHYTEDETIWEPTSGTHYGQYLLPVSASSTISQEDIGGFKVKYSDLKNYHESDLDGWQVQVADLDETSAKEICNNIVKNKEKLVCNLEVEQLNGCSTKVTYTTTNFALLPLFVLSYPYKDKTYRSLVNGLTGGVSGKMPINQAKRFGTYVAMGVCVLIFAAIGKELTGVAPIYFIVLAAIILYIYSRQNK